MATTSEVVHCYSQLASKVALMVQLAHAKEWGGLPVLESQCAGIVTRLRAIEPLAMLNVAQVIEVRRLIKRIHTDQTTVSGMVKPQLERLLENMSSLQRQKSLGKAYGPSH